MVKFDIDNVGSLAENDCVPTTFAEADNYLGGDNTYDDYKTSTGYVDDKGVTTSRANYNNLVNKEFVTKSFNPSDITSPNAMQQVQNSGDLISIHMKISNGMFHADNLRSISYYSNKIVMLFRIGSYKFNSSFFTNNVPKFFRLSGIY